MPEPLRDLEDAHTLLPTVLQHLPNVNSNPDLANVVFNVIIQAHRSHDPHHFIIPLLPSLTAVTLMAPPSLFPSASNVIVTLTRSLVARRLTAKVSSYLVDLVFLTRRLLESRSCASLPFTLPSFPPTNTFLLPLTSSTVYAAFALLAVHIPSMLTLPPMLTVSATTLCAKPSPTSASTLPCPLATRLWHSISSYARSTVLNLAARYEIVSERVGPLIARIAVHLLRRAFDPTCSALVPASFRNRIIHVIGGSFSSSSDPVELLHLVAIICPHRRIPGSIWAQCALPHALQTSPAGDAARSFLRAGRVILSSVLRPTKRTSDRPLLDASRPHKRAKLEIIVEPDDDTLESELSLESALQEAFSVFSASRHNDYDSDLTLRSGHKPPQMFPQISVRTSENTADNPHSKKRRCKSPAKSEPAEKDSAESRQGKQLELDEQSNMGLDEVVSNRSGCQKRRSPDSKDSVGSIKDGSEAARTPSVVLQKLFARRSNVERCAETPNFVYILANAVLVTADTLCTSTISDSLSRRTVLCGETGTEWYNLSISLSHILLDVTKAFSRVLSPSVWPAVLTMACACIRLNAAISLSQEHARVPVSEITGACAALQEVAISVLSIAVAAFKSAPTSIPTQQFSLLLHRIGDFGLHSRAYHARSELMKTISSLTQCILSLPDVLSKSCQAALLKAVFRARVATGPFDSTSCSDSSEITKRLLDLVEDKLNTVPELSAAALHALSSEVCLSRECYISQDIWCFQDHVASVSVGDDFSRWSSVLRSILPSIQSIDAVAVSIGALRCLSALVVHCPPAQRADFLQILTNFLWRAEEPAVAQAVISSLSNILVHEKKEREKFLESCEAARSDREESGAEEASLVSLLTAELKSRVETVGLSRIENKEVVNKSTLHTIRPAASYILFNINDLDSSYLCNLAYYALLTTCTLEVNRSGPFLGTSQISGQLVDHSSEVSMMVLCGDVVFSALILQERNERIRMFNQAPTLNACQRLFHPFEEMFHSSFSIPLVVASMFTASIEKWLPLCLPRMFEDDAFVALIVKMVSERDTRSFWEKVPRYVMTTLILKKDVAAIDSLSSKLQKSKIELIDSTFPDTFAAMLMNQPASLDQNSIIFQGLEKPITEIIRGRVGGKIVLRLIMELGGRDEGAAKSALSRFAKLVGVGKAVSADTDSTSGLLVQNHFMLVMDAVNRRLFQSRATEDEQLRHLRMLGGVISISKNCLHVFVPKILATLKLAIDTFSGNHRVCISTLQVWSSFLNTLGSARIVAHAASILAIIIPFLGRLENILCDNLSSLIEQSASLQYTDRSLVVLLLRIADREPLGKAANVLECSGECGQVKHPGSSSEQRLQRDVMESQMDGIERVCRDITKIIAKHGNGKIEVMAAQYFLRLLRVNREKVNEAGLTRNIVGKFEGDSDRSIARLASVMRLLVKQLTTTPNTECQRVIMQCIGEIGAVDPSIVSQNVGISPPNGRQKPTRIQSYPTNVHALVALLLDDFLVPTLRRGEVNSDSANRQNRIGLVIQELLRVSGCSRNTAQRASKAPRVRNPADEPIQWKRILVGETSEENAIYFWENLLSSTREVIEPYLSEPFDVQLYKGVFGGDSAGNKTLACQPVWSKIKAAVSVGVVANAQEWRRQAIVQLVDFIGKQGMFGEVLRALRPVLRYEDNLAAYVFPLVIVTVLDSQEDKNNNELKNFLIKEIADVLREASSPEVIFDLFDVLRDWREERCVIKAHEFANSPDGPLAKTGSTVSANKLKAALPKFAEIAKGCDPISSFVDLYEHVSPSLSLLSQAEYAFRAHSYPRAILLAENHVRQVRIKRELQTWPACLEVVLGRTSSLDPDNNGEAEACSILQKSFAGLDDAESMSGIAALRTSSSLSELVIDTEVSGRFNQALSTYERAIAENPRSVQFHQGFLRCLMSLGHWETMMYHAKGLLHSAKLNEMELRKTAEANGIEAAWRLGRWDNISMFDNIPAIKCENVTSMEPVNKWELDFTALFGKMIFALHERDSVRMRSAANAAREHLLIPLRRAALDGYSRAYPMIVRLHSVSDVEDVFDDISSKEKKSEEDRNSLENCLKSPQYARLHSLNSRIAIRDTLQLPLSTPYF